MKKTTHRKQLKLEKKKRKKKQERRATRPSDLAYTGRKYQKDKYVPIFITAETAILETFAMSDRRMDDDDVREGVTTLITWLRKGAVPALEDLSPEQCRTFSEEDFLASNILNHWCQEFTDSPPVGRDVLIGVLRTTLASIDTWGSKGPRGYLHYIEEFLGNAGIEVREVTMEELDALQYVPEP